MLSDCVRILLLNGKCAFYVDIHQRRTAFCPDALQLALQRAIILTGIHHLPFHKFIAINPVLELLLRQKIIVAAIQLARARPAGAGLMEKASCGMPPAGALPASSCRSRMGQ